MDELERGWQDDPAERGDAERPGAPESDLAVPAGAVGAVILCACGRVRDTALEEVARALFRAGLATLRQGPDTGTAGEAVPPAPRRGTGRRVDWMAAALDRLADEPRTRGLPVGILATGPAVPAALRTAASRKRRVRAVVAVEGRPELAGTAVDTLRAATLLVVPGLDAPMLRANHRVLQRLRPPAMLQVVPGAVHALEEADERRQVGRRIVDWFCTHVGCTDPGPGGVPSRTLEPALILTE
ncbi:MAG TPA: hypothetical protein VEQ60_01030 [Longimicrobium sp.]|nr:hypothetical protein [Longimicrobium sp.]